MLHGVLVSLAILTDALFAVTLGVAFVLLHVALALVAYAIYTIGRDVLCRD